MSGGYAYKKLKDLTSGDKTIDMGISEGGDQRNTKVALADRDLIIDKLKQKLGAEADKVELFFSVNPETGIAEPEKLRIGADFKSVKAKQALVALAGSDPSPEGNHYVFSEAQTQEMLTSLSRSGPPKR